jgi:hypothetical protein
MFKNIIIIFLISTPFMLWGDSDDAQIGSAGNYI